MVHIWPIGGGKGGSGKSFLAGNLGISLAMMGRKTLIIDADFGAANLHTIIGMANPERCLSDFLNKKVKALEETVLQTPVSNLSMISGARNNLDIANLAYEQKAKILRAISRLDFEFILIDLGAGTSFNTIDFFLISDCGILVTTPEPTSIENVYRLIRSLYMRKIRQIIGNYEFKTLLDKASLRPQQLGMDFLQQILIVLKETDPEKGHSLEDSLRNQQFRIVINQCRKHDNPQLGLLICKIVEKHLGLHLQFVGNISFDDRVHDAICKKISFVSKFPYTQTATDLQEFCGNMLLSCSEPHAFRSVPGARREMTVHEGAG
ncbi:MAG: AAA family ATPase [Syntrophales bacterium]|nr:AAA family ATPase [Syntrophales bacterium]MDD5234071.1 AAA family ATPase [Syntrophales bacterium]MDD5531839.1 AAA family ATPase [Syntrophales bacterium]